MIPRLIIMAVVVMLLVGGCAKVVSSDNPVECDVDWSGVFTKCRIYAHIVDFDCTVEGNDMTCNFVGDFGGGQ